MLKVGNNKFLLIIKNTFLYISIIFFSIFSAIPIKFFSGIIIFPNIASILIFYFLIIKQDNTKYFSIFILGLLFDVFNSLPIGTTSLTWLLSSKFISFLRQHFYTPDNFISSFRDFIIFTFLNSLIQWIIFSILFRTVYPVLNSVLQFILNIIFFAVLYKLLKKVEEYSL